jgi:hypothetical protein
MTTLRRLWTSNAPLTAAGLLMVAALATFLAGLGLDPRVITGAPAWLKPAKFAASTAIFMFTLAWMFSYLPGWPRLRRTVGWITAATLVLEVSLITLQAWRGTTSHFNVGTPLDAAVFGLMAAGILVQTTSTVAATVALWRQAFADPAFGWAVRLGMVIALLGASTGGLMTQPTAAQLADARAGHRVTVVGAHTVGAQDGGPGLPGTGWSLQHGDLRVPHFLGLHAMQLLPLIALVVVRRSAAEARRVRLVWLAGASYFALFALLLAQALRGEALAAPSPVTIAAFIVWASGTAAAAWIDRGGAAPLRTNAAVLEYDHDTRGPVYDREPDCGGRVDSPDRAAAATLGR